MESRERWACPDSHPPREDGRHLVVLSTKEQFPECPAAYLRTASDVEELRGRRGGDPWAKHFIEGTTVRPIDLISEPAFEVESGARTMDTLPNKVRMLVNLKFNEEAQKRRYEADVRKESRAAPRGT